MVPCRSTAPAVNSRASISVVLPDPLGPTSAMVRALPPPALAMPSPLVVADETAADRLAVGKGLSGLTFFRLIRAGRKWSAEAIQRRARPLHGGAHVLEADEQRRQPEADQ